MRTSLLVIGYGNELRRDDGVGPQVARAVARQEWPGVKAVAVHQLTPELVELMAEAEQIVFVDARAEGREASDQSLCIPVSLYPWLNVSNCLGHAGNPCELLALTEVLHGKRPEAWLIAVPVPDLEFGTEFSPAAERGLEAALRQIRLLARNRSVSSA